jgi:hypothetical protein
MSLMMPKQSSALGEASLVWSTKLDSPQWLMPGGMSHG